MARQALTPGPVLPAAQLRSFARVAGRLFLEPSRGAGGTRSHRRRRGPGLQYIDHRDYHPGDDLRWVNWRLSARLGRPVVRQFQRETSADWMICIDASSSMIAAGNVKWRLAIRLAAAVAYTLVDLGHRAGVLMYAESILASTATGRGHAHFAGIDRTLRSVMPRPVGAVASLGQCLAALRGASAVFILSDFLDGAASQRDLLLLGRRCGTAHAIQIHDPAELQLPLIGPVDLVDVETGERASCLRAPADEATAARRAESLTRQLRNLCVGQAIEFSRATTEHGWREALLGHLARSAAA
jgi:uncharacterized protein (DUF58 family)